MTFILCGVTKPKPSILISKPYGSYNKGWGNWIELPKHSQMPTIYVSSMRPKAIQLSIQDGVLLTAAHVNRQAAYRTGRLHIEYAIARRSLGSILQIFGNWVWESALSWHGSWPYRMLGSNMPYPCSSSQCCLVQFIVASLPAFCIFSSFTITTVSDPPAKGIWHALHV